MSNEPFDTQAPFDYQTLNYYNSQRSPSTIHVKNTAIRRYFRKYLFQKAISVFKWTLPEEWDQDYFLYTLYGTGHIAVINTPKFGTICQAGSLGGYNVYYRPTYIIITNPLIPNAITAYLDKDAALIKLMPDYSSIQDIIGYYADQMALAAEALGVNLMGVKTNTIFGANTKAQAETFKKLYDQIANGEPAVVVGKNLMDEQGKPSWFPFVQDVKQSYVATDILSDMRKIEAMFDTDIGIPNANTDKRERLITDEVNANNVETATRCELWLEEIRKGLKKANEMFGLSLAVDWRVKPDFGLVSEGDTQNRPKSVLGGN